MKLRNYREIMTKCTVYLYLVFSSPIQENGMKNIQIKLF